MKNKYLSPAEKTALAAIVLCLVIFCILPRFIVHFMPSFAAALNENTWLLMLPTIIIGIILFTISKSLNISKSDFTGLGFAKLVPYTVGLIIIAALCALLWVKFLDHFQIRYDTTVPVSDFVKSCSKIELIFAMPLICIIIPLFEEIIFRRIIFEGFKYRFPLLFSMTVTSLFFAGLHGIFFQLFPLFVLGLGFQMLYVANGKLGASFFAHSFNNTLAFTMLLLI